MANNAPFLPEIKINPLWLLLCLVPILVAGYQFNQEAQANPNPVSHPDVMIKYLPEGIRVYSYCSGDRMVYVAYMKNTNSGSSNVPTISVSDQDRRCLYRGK